MRKTGEFRDADGEHLYYLVVYEGSSGSRYDILQSAEGYNPDYIDNPEASVINTNETFVYGNRELYEKIRKVISQASFLDVTPEENLSFDNGVISSTTTKVSQDGEIEYSAKLINGSYQYEVFKSYDGTVTFMGYDYYDSTALKPKTIDNYIREFTEEKKQQIATTAAGYYDFYTLWNMYPEKRHVLENPNNDYVVVESYEQGVERLNTWKNSKEKLKGIDVESYGKEWFPGSDNRITGVILGIDENWSTYFPFRQDVFDYNLPIEFIWDIFDAVNGQPKDTWIVTHNGKFEIESFMQEGRKILRVDIDTLVLSKLVYPDKKEDHSLKGLTERLTEESYLELEDIFTGKIQFNVLPKEIVKWYACPDTTNPVKILKKMLALLPSDEYNLFFQVETRLLKVKAFNEFYGMRMNQDLLKDYLPKLESDVEKLRNIFSDMHHTHKNINSADTMTYIMYQQLKINPVIFTKKGLPAVSKVAREEAIKDGYKLGPDENSTLDFVDILDHEGNVLVSAEDLKTNRYPSLIVYQQYKVLEKQLIDLKRLINNCHEGFFHFYVNQLGADSGRQTSDAQQFSNSMKKMSIADTTHHRLCSCDYHQVELRILFGLSGQKDLCELAQDPNVDLHRAVASLINRKPIYQISEEERKASKSTNFGVVYMMSEYGLAKRDKGVHYTKEDIIACRDRITSFFNTFKNIKGYLEENKRRIRETGEISTALGYHRYCPQILEPDIEESTASALVRSFNNTPIQGFCATILKMSEILIFEEFEKRGWLKEKNYDGIMRPMARLILPIHDEHLLDFDEEIPIEEMCGILKTCMEFPIEGLPTLYASPAIVDTWYDAKDDANAIDTQFRDEVLEKYSKGIKTFGTKKYYDVLEDSRKQEIDEYMQPLIAKYKTINEVAEHVDHPNLTHVLISTIPGSERKKLTHTQRIKRAVEMYMEGHKNVQEFELKDKYIESDSEGEVLEFEDDKGNVTTTTIGEVDDVEEERAFESKIVKELDSADIRFVYTLTDLFVDLTGLSDDICRSINKMLENASVDNGDYNVVYIRNRQQYRTELYVPYNPKYKEVAVNA